VRRTVGPVAWSVLEVLAEHGRADLGGTVSRKSVRDLAGELGLANDTVARALRRLADASLVVHESDRASTGRFGAGRYVLTVPSDVFVDAGASVCHSVAAAGSRRRPRPVGEQLALLPGV
jgi:predicted ArsR family transcriptional regulator